MIARTLNKGEEMLLETKNNAVVHVPNFYIDTLSPNAESSNESSYPLGRTKDIDTYERDNLLISFLASRLKHGKLVVLGNVGQFFAYQNHGADIQLDGECGWRSCYEMVGGKVTINGTAGHDLGLYANGGQIFVNGRIRSIGSCYTVAYRHNIYHNGELVPKREV